jgi:2-C-methyl-D-erythritol 4-phosphate cytidylyltransferase
MKYYAIIVAGGKGARMKNKVPKQFMLLNGKPVLMHSIERFFNANSDIKIIVVLPKAGIKKWKELCHQFSFLIPHQVIAGGETRFDSVKKGLSLVKKDGLVAVHDGVRPLVSIPVIRKVYRIANINGNGIPCLPMKESVRVISGKKNNAVDRQTLWRIQTPQCFRVKILKNAYKQKYKKAFMDDASVVESAGWPIYLVKDREDNIKITTPEDLIFAEALMNKNKNKR